MPSNQQIMHYIIFMGILLLCIFHCVNLPPKPEFDNPEDINSSHYVPPQVTITEQPTDTCLTDSVVFKWSGNEYLKETRYRLAGRDTGWTAWDTAKHASYSYLDEGDYIFYLQGRNKNEDYCQDSACFTVNAVQGPALLIKPYYSEAAIGDSIVLEVWAEEVTDLMAASIALVLDTSRTKLAKVEEGDFLKMNNGRTVLLNTVSACTLFLDMGTSRGNPPAVTGSGVLAKLCFIADKIGNSEMLLNTEKCELRDHVQQDTTIKQGRSGIVHIK